MTAADYRYVIIADGHYNPMGLARSLGREGIVPEAIVIGGDDAYIAKSKYSKIIAYVKNPKEAVDYALKNLANPEKKAFLMTNSDAIMDEINRNYHKLAPYFITYNFDENVVGGVIL